MSSFDSVLREESLLTESGIRIPSGTHAAKVIFHADMDGVFSALLTVNQLIKQGIPKENIKLEMAQYGAKPDEFLKKWGASKGQMVAVVDFAGFPSEVPGVKENGDFDYKNTRKVRNPDFVSDHHQDTPDAYGNSRLNKGSEKPSSSHAIGKTQYHSDSSHIATVFAKHLADPTTIEAVTKIDSAKYANLLDTLTLPKEFKRAGRMDRLANLTNTLISQLIKKNQTAVFQIVKNSSPSLVSVYNNTLKYSKLHGKQVEIYKELGEETPDWGKIDTLRNELPSVMKKETGVENKKDSLSSLDDLRKKGQEDVETAKTGYWSPKDQKRLDILLGKAEKSQKDPGFSDISDELLATYKKDFTQEIEELTNQVAVGHPVTVPRQDKGRMQRQQDGSYAYPTLTTSVKEMEHALQMSKDFLVAIDKELAVRNAEKDGSSKEVDELTKKKKESKGKFATVGNVMRLDAAGRGQPGRFVGSLLSKDETGKLGVSEKGKRYPFTIRRWPTMFQVALNPDFPKDVAKPDLGEIAKKVLRIVRDKHEVKEWPGRDNWAWDLVFKQSGGHASITNISGLNFLKMLPKEERKELKTLQEYKNKIGGIAAMRAKMPNKAKRLEALEDAKERASEKRNAIVNDIEKEFYRELQPFKSTWVRKPLNDKPEEEPKPDPTKIQVGKPWDKESKKKWGFEEELFDVAGELTI